MILQKKVSSGAKSEKTVCLILAAITIMVAFSIVYWETKTVTEVSGKTENPL